jgi:hypothetical protein
MPHVNNFYKVKTRKNFYHGGSKMLSLIFHAGLFHESNFILCMVKKISHLRPIHYIGSTMEFTSYSLPCHHFYCIVSNSRTKG